MNNLHNTHTNTDDINILTQQFDRFNNQLLMVNGTHSNYVTIFKLLFCICFM